MTIKLVGVSLIIACGGMLGLWQADKIRLRQKTLEQTRLLISSIRQLLLYTEDTPNSLLHTVSQMENLGELDFVANAVNFNNGLFSDGWRKAVENTALPITAKDKELIIGIGDILGRSDLETQARYLTLAEEALASIILALQQDNHRQIKLTQTLGILMGVFVAIIIM